MALKRRGPSAGLLHHSDQGCTYASEDYQAVLTTHGIACSMSRRGNCFDNAVIESFWSRMQVELLDRQRWQTRVEQANAIFEYLEIFYNRKRRHSMLGMLTPLDFEARHEPGPSA